MSPQVASSSSSRTLGKEQTQSKERSEYEISSGQVWSRQTDDDFDNEAAMFLYLGSEDHQLLMDQIESSLKEEYSEEILMNELGEFETKEYGDDFCLEEEELNEDRFIICPVCRFVILDGARMCAIMMFF
jgi:catalase